MSIFQSTTRAQAEQNAYPDWGPMRDEDPAPWLYRHSDGTPGSRSTFWSEDHDEWAPRPEFRPPVNPILTALREHTAREVEWAWANRPDMILDAWLRSLDTGTSWPSATPEQIDHARKVLARLAALS